MTRTREPDPYGHAARVAGAVAVLWRLWMPMLLHHNPLDVETYP